MREIKFRAWDIKRKLMTVFNLTEIYADCCGNVGFLKNAPHQHENDSWKDFELMQYTSLKDKNEKEIYEGDVLRSKVGYLYVVDFQYGSFGAYWTKEKNIWHSCSSRSFEEKEFEIVGNIFENPKLLKKYLVPTYEHQAN